MVLIALVSINYPTRLLAIFCLDVLFWFPGVVMIVVAFPMYQYFVVYKVLYEYCQWIRRPKVCHLRDLDRPRVCQTALQTLPYFLTKHQ
jgi:hypothetical protein